MSRAQWACFTVGMIGMFGTGAFCLPKADMHPSLLLIPFSFMVLLLAGTLGWSLVRAIRNVWNRRHGIQVVGRVMHARSSGYTNHVPTWEVEAVLPDGTTTHLLIDRFGPFHPGEPIELVVNPRDPTHATLPPHPSYDF